jgi:RimJ/RimL family protein N-acetyltransferase
MVKTRSKKNKSLRIETERLVLRGFEDHDLDNLVKGIGDIAVSRNLLLVPYPYTKKDGKWWLNHCKEEQCKKERVEYNFAMELASEGRFIGAIGLSKVKEFEGTAEVGYWLAAKYHRQGYMSEALMH